MINLAASQMRRTGSAGAKGRLCLEDWRYGDLAGIDDNDDEPGTGNDRRYNPLNV